MQAKYRCVARGPRNNRLLKSCGFEFMFEEGSHNCPQCGQPLTWISTGKSVAQILREGLEEERKHNKS